MKAVEYRILTAAVALTPDAGHRHHLEGLLASGFDARRLIEMAAYEGLAGLLYKRLAQTDTLKFFDSDHRRWLESLYFLTVRDNLILLHDLKEILQELNRKNIPVVVLQGMALLPIIYEDIGLRPLTDIDFWVLPENREALVDVLDGLTYEADGPYRNTFKRGSTIIDVNTHILWADRIRSRRFMLRKGQRSMYQKTRPMVIEGQQTLCLGDFDLILYLSLHVLKHNVSRLVWLVDLHRLLTELTWGQCKELVERAKVLGLEKSLACIVFLLRNLFGTDLKMDMQPVPRCMRLNRLEKKMLTYRLNGDALPEWSTLMVFTSGQRLPRKIALALETLYPRPEVLRQIYTDTPGNRDWKLYLRRTRQLFGSAIKV